MIELLKVTRRFDASGGAASITVLREVTICVAASDTVAVCGPSGAGKSTLLNLLGALDVPTEGSVRFDGCDLAAMSVAALAALRNQRIGFIFQMHHLLPQCTALENVLLPTLAGHASLSRDHAVARGRALLERIGLGDRLDHMPGQLSGGEQQRVAVARALVNAPRLILADEPTGSLDDAASSRVMDELEILRREQDAALIVVTHSAAVADRMARKMTLREGCLEEGS